MLAMTKSGAMSGARTSATPASATMRDKAMKISIATATKSNTAIKGMPVASSHTTMTTNPTSTVHKAARYDIISFWSPSSPPHLQARRATASKWERAFHKV